ncbi:hypothetical protein GMLC_21630 [Geomonas limicola]|uniref:Uncharacterized protein n=1 Tax=Geomonas limicola TaxID=2740186 RepID=A0A6V8N9M1_9BACT|nr:hypothetical protein [Geomonas limicola]GFO68584.1 hypothetical protein GMLC_21630 [Geomonas limicola]
MKQVDSTIKAAELKKTAYIKLMKQRGELLVVLVTPVMVGSKNKVTVMPRSLVAAYKASGYNQAVLTGDCLGCKFELALLTTSEKREAAGRLLKLAADHEAELLDVPADIQPFLIQ